MAETGQKTNLELATTDIFAMSDAALIEHINALQVERNQLKSSVVPAVSECNALIAIAHSVLSSRATDRMARTAIWISVVAFVTSCAFSALSILLN